MLHVDALRPEGGLGVQCQIPFQIFLLFLISSIAGKWKEVERSGVKLEHETISLACASALVQKRIYREIVDFDNHLDDISQVKQFYPGMYFFSKNCLPPPHLLKIFFFIRHTGMRGKDFYVFAELGKLNGFLG